MGHTTGQRKAWGICGLVYVVATLAGGAAYWASVSAHGVLWALFIGDAVGTLVVFIASVLFNNSSLYDPYWSVAPMVIGAWLWVDSAPGAHPRMLVAVLLTWIWGARLTYNFCLGWSSLTHEDWRYRDLRDSTGRAYWIVSFLGIHFFPTVLVFLGLLSLYAMASAETGALGMIDGLGILLTVSAIIIESRADAQLRTFREHNTDPSRILDTGLWAWCRHPNYFGEIMFWWGLSFLALGASTSNWWVFIGPIAITALFQFISLRLIDTRMLRRRPHYAEHCKRVPALIPKPPVRIS